MRKSFVYHSVNINNSRENQTFTNIWRTKILIDCSSCKVNSSIPFFSFEENTMHIELKGKFFNIVKLKLKKQLTQKDYKCSIRLQL